MILELLSKANSIFKDYDGVIKKSKSLKIHTFAQMFPILEQ